ncbi:polysaccharide deacetylase family protein [Sporomusa malonica]|uniref:Polysaccharide deacetylase n=1 Tax=Sporomusa malonica TaxID=112901 RepID=A0A1W1YTK6_9FIRM|nr:polysaccharide deacetylase family protein [Sporomusa malonica]SMC39489.1 Polysaccharide deacetylase [Sporomusa malonica]
MNNKLTVVMYHYVRELKNSRFPELKALDVKLFKQQLDFLQRNYNIITMNDVVECIQIDKQLPPKAVLLTFDDAYLDHYLYVFPELVSRGLFGAFYPPAKAITQQEVLDVNKIHLILSAVGYNNTHVLVKYLLQFLKNFQSDWSLQDAEYYYEKIAIANRFDTANTVFVKRLLQVELPLELRKIAANQLLQEHLGISEATISRELYMTIDQIKLLSRYGMHVGSHGYDHFWLDRLSEQELTFEIDMSLDFLNTVNGTTVDWTMCYPYGGYNETTKKLLESRNCQLAVTTKVDVARVTYDSRFDIPRLDTNDLPTASNAEPNKWYING